MTADSIGPYRLLRELGAGGMGYVHLAEDTRLGRRVAVKQLHGEWVRSPDARRRLLHEARAAATLNHPNIAAVYDVIEEADRACLVLEYVEGGSLDERVERGRVPVPEVVEIGLQLAEALVEAHAHGVIHRDLKPANARITPAGRVKVLDFGIAKELRAVDPAGATFTSAGQTQAGVVMGTPAYMSPEQVAGRAVDHRSDIFSLGVLLYEMAGGRRPFEGASSAELASAILRDTPPSLAEVRRDVPAELARVVQRCLEKDPSARYQSTRDVQAALSFSTSGGSGRLSPPAGRSRRYSLVLAVAGGGVILVGAAAYLATRSAPVRPSSDASEAVEVRSIAVLPLDNYSGDPGQDYFAEGMTDELTAKLATISRLRVISRGSAMQFRGAHRPPTPQIAKTLDVDAIVEGSVLRSGDRVRITAQLIEARADRHLWARSFERSSRDVLALQDELASAIAREIHVQLTPAEQSRLATAPSVNPQAYDAYSEWLGWLGADRIFDPLRSEPRFAALIRKLGLEGVRERVIREASAPSTSGAAPGGR